MGIVGYAVGSGDGAVRAEVGDIPAIRRPARTASCAGGAGKLFYFLCLHIYRPQFSVVDTVGILCPVADKGDMPAVGRPAQGMFIVIAAGDQEGIAAGCRHAPDMRQVFVGKNLASAPSLCFIGKSLYNLYVARRLIVLPDRQGAAVGNVFSIGRPGKILFREMAHEIFG